MVTLGTLDWVPAQRFPRLLVCSRHPVAPACTWDYREWGSTAGVHSTGHAEPNPWKPQEGEVGLKKQTFKKNVY